jgi:hypothetical protein
MIIEFFFKYNKKKNLHTQSRALAVRPELVDESDPERELEREREGDFEYERSRLRPMILFLRQK